MYLFFFRSFCNFPSSLLLGGGGYSSNAELTEQPETLIDESKPNLSENKLSYLRDNSKTNNPLIESFRGSLPRESHSELKGNVMNETMSPIWDSKGVEISYKLPPLDFSETSTILGNWKAENSVSKLALKKMSGRAVIKLGYTSFLKNLYSSLLTSFFWDDEGKEFWLYDMEVTMPSEKRGNPSGDTAILISKNLNQNSYITPEFSNDDSTKKINTYKISLTKEKIEEVLRKENRVTYYDEKLGISEIIMKAQKFRAQMFQQFFDKNWDSQIPIEITSDGRAWIEDKKDWSPSANATIQLSKGVRPGLNINNTYHRLRFIREYEGRYYYCDLYFAGSNYTTQLRSQYIYYVDKLWNKGSYYQANGVNGGIRNHIGGLESKDKSSGDVWTEIDSSISRMWDNFETHPWIAWRWLEILKRTMNDREGYKTFISNQYFYISQKKKPIPRTESWKKDVYKKIHPLAQFYYQISEEMQTNPATLSFAVLKQFNNLDFSRIAHA